MSLLYVVEYLCSSVAVLNSSKNWKHHAVPKAPSTPATMSKQHCRMLQVERFFRQSWMLLRHCCRFWQRNRMLLRQSRTLLRHCCWCGRGLTVLCFQLPFITYYRLFLVVQMKQSTECPCVRTIASELYDIDLHILHAGSSWRYLGQVWRPIS